MCNGYNFSPEHIMSILHRKEIFQEMNRHCFFETEHIGPTRHILRWQSTWLWPSSKHFRMAKRVRMEMYLTENRPGNVNVSHGQPGTGSPTWSCDKDMYSASHWKRVDTLHFRGPRGREGVIWPWVWSIRSVCNEKRTSRPHSTGKTPHACSTSVESPRSLAKFNVRLQMFLA